MQREIILMRTDGEWMRCGKCGHKLLRYAGELPLRGVEVKCHSCKTINVSSEPQKWWVFTFGYGQEHAGKFVRFYGTYGEARSQMCERFDDRWAFQYDMDEWLRNPYATEQELLEGAQYTNAQIAQMFSKKFIVQNNPLVVKEVNNVYSHCEHHLALMYNMRVIVAYLPVCVGHNQYEVIGLSKIPRIVDLCAKRLQLQEQLAADIGECISIATGSNDVYVEIMADHACVCARGAKSEGGTNTTLLLGRFLTDEKLRNEIERKVK